MLHWFANLAPFYITFLIDPVLPVDQYMSLPAPRGLFLVQVLASGVGALYKRVKIARGHAPPASFRLSWVLVSPSSAVSKSSMSLVNFLSTTARRICADWSDRNSGRTPLHFRGEAP